MRDPATPERRAGAGAETARAMSHRHRERCAQQTVPSRPFASLGPDPTREERRATELPRRRPDAGRGARRFQRQRNGRTERAAMPRTAQARAPSPDDDPPRPRPEPMAGAYRPFPPPRNSWVGLEGPTKEAARPEPNGSRGRSEPARRRPPESRPRRFDRGETRPPAPGFDRSATSRSHRADPRVSRSRRVRELPLEPSRSRVAPSRSPLDPVRPSWAAARFLGPVADEAGVVRCASRRTAPQPSRTQPVRRQGRAEARAAPRAPPSRVPAPPRSTPGQARAARCAATRTRASGAVRGGTQVVDPSTRRATPRVALPTSSPRRSPLRAPPRPGTPAPGSAGPTGSTTRRVAARRRRARPRQTRSRPAGACRE